MEDLEILSWLPAKTIFKFKSISKTWNALFSEEFFIKKQSLNMQSKEEDFGFFIQPSSCQRYTDKLEPHGYESTTVVPRRALDFVTKMGRILASKNGLVCCRNTSINRVEKTPCFFTCNLVNQTWCPIYAPDDLNLIGSGMDFKVVFETDNELFGDYTLMLFKADTTAEWDFNYQLSCTIYSAKEGIWKGGGLISCGGRNLQPNLMPVSHDGRVFFLSDFFPFLSKGNPFYWPYIIVYDIRNGVSKFLKLPKDARKCLFDKTCKIGIFKYRRHLNSKFLCLVQVKKSVCTVWILVDYNLSSWTRILKKRVKAMGIWDSNATISGFMVNGKWLLLATKRKAFRYDLESDQCVGKVEDVCWHKCGRNVTFQSYSSTLRPCGNGETLIPV